MNQTKYDKQINFIEKNELSTPVTFFDTRKLHESLQVLNEVYDKNISIFYAIKSCYNKNILNSLSSANVGVEVLSELEYELAKAAGFNSILLNGMGRSYDLLSRTINDGNIVLVDSINDLKNLKIISNETDKPLRLGFRLRLVLSSIDPENSYVSDDHPLGNYIDSDLVRQFFEFCNTQPNANWEMLHTHLTINETSPGIYIKGMEKIVSALIQLKKTYGLRPTILNLGGGFEVYNSNQRETFLALFGAIKQEFKNKFNGYKMAIEPGRYLSGYAGYTIGKILDIKLVGDKSWIITDIGTNTLIPIPNSRYNLVVPDADKKEGKYLIGVTDGITSPANNIIFEARVDNLPEVGSYICIENTGAYTDVYSTFWAYPPHIVCNINTDGKISIYRDSQDIDQLRNIFFK
jgi:diaminopimelate decarboxylase